MNRLVNKALYLEQLKRFWPIAAISMLYLLYIIQPIYFPSSGQQWRMPHNHMLDVLRMANPMLLIPMVAVPFFSALALFSYPYRTASATAYHSLPVNRTQLFFTHVLAGLTLMLVPLILLSLVMLIPVRFVGTSFGIPVMYFGQANILVGETVNTVPRVIGFFLRSALGFTMYFALFALAASVAGNRVIAVILSGVFALAPAGLVGLAELIGSFYIFGLGGVSMQAAGRVAMFTNPVGWFMAYSWRVDWRVVGAQVSVPQRNLLPFFISYGAITLVGFGLAFLANRLRPHERVGDTVAFLPVKRVLVFLFSLAGMAIMGMFWLNVTGSRFLFYAGFVLGFVVAYYIAQAIAEKTFQVGHKAKYLITYGAAAVGLYVIMLLVTGLGFWGYVRNVPQLDEITGVIVEESRILATRPGRGQTPEEHFFTDDPATIAMVREIHQGIVDNRRYLQQSRWETAGVVRGWLTPLSITYRLADGSTIHRSYLLTWNFHSNWNIDNLMSSTPVLLSHHPALTRPEVIASVGLNFSLFDITLSQLNLYQPWITINQPQQIQEITQAIIEDIVPRHYRPVEWENTIHVELGINMPYAQKRWGWTWFTVPIDGYVGQWLADNGFISEDLREIVGP